MLFLEDKHVKPRNLSKGCSFVSLCSLDRKILVLPMLPRGNSVFCYLHNEVVY